MQEAFLVYRPGEHGSVQDFCTDALAPSSFFAYGRQPSAAWLYVQNEVNPSEQGYPASYGRAVAAGLERKQLFLNERDKTKKKAIAVVEDIHKCAAQYGCATGKWMLRVSESNIDHKWLEIAKATVDGTLGATSAKVGRSPGQEIFLVCVYLNDYEDKALVGGVLQGLRGLHNVVPKADIFFKADILTGCQIDASFYTGVRVSRWSSRYQDAATPASAAALLTIGQPLFLPIVA